MPLYVDCKIILISSSDRSVDSAWSCERVYAYLSPHLVVVVQMTNVTTSEIDDSSNDHKTFE
jgi:hypothetical protein